MRKSLVLLLSTVLTSPAWAGQVTNPTTVTYGTAAGTAAQGNDPRIVGALPAAQVNSAAGVAPLDGNKLLPTANVPFGTVAGKVADGGTLTATTATANAALPKSQVGASSGVAPLDVNKLLPSANVPFGTAAGTVADGGTLASTTVTANSASTTANAALPRSGGTSTGPQIAPSLVANGPLSSTTYGSSGAYLGSNLSATEGDLVGVGGVNLYSGTASSASTVLGLSISGGGVVNAPIALGTSGNLSLVTGKAVILNSDAGSGISYIYEDSAQIIHLLYAGLSVGGATSTAALSASGVATLSRYATSTITASQTLTATQCGQRIWVNSSSPVTLTMGSFSSGCEIEAIQQGAGIVTIANASGLTALVSGTGAATVNPGDSERITVSPTASTYQVEGISAPVASSGAANPAATSVSTASYQITATDCANGFKQITGTSANTVTVPTGLPLTCRVNIEQAAGAGAVQIVAGSGMALPASSSGVYVQGPGTFTQVWLASSTEIAVN